MRGAVLDLGTNTFNLLIVDILPDKNFKVVISTKRSVKLGFGGINKDLITPEAFTRGINAICSLHGTMKKYKPEIIFAFATSAIRSASNGNEFTENIRQKFGFKIDIITGDKEAEYIYRGIRKTNVLTDEKMLILDIGGGSNEFIIADKNEIYWKESFNIGIARLIEKFQPADPITFEEIALLEDYFEQRLVSLFEAARQYNLTTLIGSSGSFESFSKMIAFKNRSKDTTVKTLTLKDYFELHEIFLKSTLAERKRMKGLVLMRTEMIVLASIFTNFIINKLNISKLIKTDFSLKEGVIDEIIEQQIK